MPPIARTLSCLLMERIEAFLIFIRSNRPSDWNLSEFITFFEAINLKKCFCSLKFNAKAQVKHEFKVRALVISQAKI